MKTRFVQLGPISIACHESDGRGPAVIFVHGNSCSAQSFQRQLKSPLGDRFRLVAIDLPGHGQSGNARDTTSTYSLPGYAAIVCDAVHHLGLHDAVLAGCSLGGHIVLEASQHLPRAAGFMIFGTPPVSNPPELDRAFLPHPIFATLFNRQVNDAEVAAWLDALCAAGAESLPLKFAEDIRRTDGNARTCLGQSIAANLFADELNIVTRLKKPLAIIHGERDVIVNSDYLRAVPIPSLWRQKVQLIPDAGHIPQWEQPERFNALLEAFLGDCCTRS